MDETNAQAISRFFRLPGEDLKTFTEGYKRLTEADKQDLGDAIRTQAPKGE